MMYPIRVALGGKYTFRSNRPNRDSDLGTGGLAGLDDRGVQGRALLCVALKLVFAQVVGTHTPTFLGQLDVHEGAIVACLPLRIGPPIRTWAL